MSSDWSDFLSRDELLGGLPARRASTLLFAIESRTAHLVVRARRAMGRYHTEASVEGQERVFLEALAQGRELPLLPTIQDLERYAPQWADLVPLDPVVRAAIARMMGAKYRLPKRATPSIRSVLGLNEDAVQGAYARLHGEPLNAIYADDLTWPERLRWSRSRLAHRLETLPPFWTAFALTLTETVGAGVLALPIATARIGPIGGLVVILTLGLINILTIAAVAEAVARNGSMRYGQAYFGRLVRDYLGNAGLWILAPALTLFFAIVLLAYYVGLSTTLAAATGIPAPVWVALAFLAALAILRRESLDATVASALVVGATCIGLILLLALLAVPHVSVANLRHMSVPFVNGEPFDATLLELIFGVVLLAYFGHTSAGNCAAVVLQRDPSARSFIRGSVAAITAAMVIYSVWVVAVNGAVGPEGLADESGTALGPLAAKAGVGVLIFGSIFAVLAMGMASIHVSLGLSNQVREWLPSVPNGAKSVGGWRKLCARPMGRFVLGILPVAFVFLVVEALLLTGRESFTEPLGFLGVITSSVIGGIFPMLMVVASRQKGDVALGGIWRLVGDPAVAIVISAVFLAGLVLHGLVLWQQPYQRVAALLVAVATIVVATTAIRQGAFRRCAVVEVRVEPAMTQPAVVNVVVAGQSVPVGIRWPNGAGSETGADFRSVEIDLPELSIAELRVWVHYIDPTGKAEALPALLELDDGNGLRQIDLRSSGGHIIVPTSGSSQQIRRIRITTTKSG